MKKAAASLTFVAILFATILTSCSFNRTYTNRQEDKAEAEQVSKKFFELMKAKKYEESAELFGEKFFEVTDKEKLFAIYKTAEEKLGELQETTIDSWETKIVIGTNPSSIYVLIYKNKYEKFEATESFRMMKEADGKIKIVGYKITSDAFINV